MRRIVALSVLAVATGVGASPSAQAYGVCTRANAELGNGMVVVDHPWDCLPRPAIGEPLPPREPACFREEWRFDHVEVCFVLWS